MRLNRRHNIVHPHLFCLGEFERCFSLLSLWGGRTTTCIVITPPGTSPTGTRDSPRVLLFSSILPALMSFTSLRVFGTMSLSCGHRERTNSLSAVTVVAGSYLLGPMSVPSNSRNLTSIGSFPPAIFPAGRVKAQDPNNRSGDRWPAQSTTAGGGIGGGKAAEFEATRARNRCGSHEVSAFSFS